MSRLSLKKSQPSKPHYGPLGLPSKQAGGASQQTNGRSSSAAAATNPAARPGGSDGGERLAASAPAQASDSWGSSSEEDGLGSAQQENQQPQQPQQTAALPAQKRRLKPAGGPSNSGEQPSQAGPHTTPLNPSSAGQLPSSQRKSDIGEVYDINDSSSDDDEAGKVPAVCGSKLLGLSSQQRQRHVVSCRGASSGAAPQQGRQQATLQEQSALLQEPVQQQAAGNPLLQMNARQWLKALGLERYHQLFEEHDIDLTCVHAVSAEELASIGIADRLHQARIVQAAEALASQLGLRQLRGTGSGSGARQLPLAAKRRKQLSLLAAGSNHCAAGTIGAAAGTEAAAAEAAHAAQGAQQEARHQLTDNPHRDAAPRPEERALLASLYPAPQPAAANSPTPGAQGAAPQRLTPQLAGGRSLLRGAPAGAASLWAGAAACCAVAPTLGARLARREAADPDGAAARRQPLARGGTAYPAGEESRALKRVRLDALRQELRMHEETVAGLRAMIAQLERDVGERGADVG
ncbi:hypothetical protein ABPG77_004756 [Micractinium sp. CCAP 211/92]